MTKDTNDSDVSFFAVISLGFFFLKMAVTFNNSEVAEQRQSGSGPQTGSFIWNEAISKRKKHETIKGKDIEKKK